MPEKGSHLRVSRSPRGPSSIPCFQLGDMPRCRAFFMGWVKSDFTRDAVVCQIIKYEMEQVSYGLRAAPG